MTRVAFVVADLGMGGAERHVTTLAPALDRDRFEVVVYCLSRRGDLFDVVDGSGIDAVCLEAGGRARNASAVWRLWRSWMRDRPDVVVTSGFRAGMVGRLAARSIGVRATVVWKHNIGHLGAVGVKERASEVVMQPLTSRYLAVCHSQIRYLVDYMRLEPSRIGVVHNSVPVVADAEPRSPRQGLDRQRLGLSADDLVIGVVAVLRKEKDHPTLLRALADLHRRSIAARLVVVGDGPDRDALERLAIDLGVAKSVLFLGQRRDVADLLPLFDVVALPSFTVECFPYAILEAMAAARPVVATAVGGLPEMVEHGVTGLLVPPRAPRALSEALAAVLSDPAAATLMGKTGQVRLGQRWPFERAVREVEDALNRVIDDEQRGSR